MKIKSSSGNRPPSKISNLVKILTHKILIFIAFSETQPVSSNDIKSKFDISRQVLNYHIKKLHHLGFIKKSVKDFIHFYEVTKLCWDKGVKTLSDRSMDGILGLHNITFKFKILRDKPIPFKETTQMRGWKLYRTFLNGYCVLKTPNYLIVYPTKPNERFYGFNAEKLRDNARDKAREIAQYYVDRYGIELGLPETSRKAHWGKGSYIARKFRGELTTDTAKIDDSEGTGGEIDFLTAETAQEHLNLPKKVDEIGSDVKMLTKCVIDMSQTMISYQKQINAHIPALQGITKVAKKLDNLLSQKRIDEYVRDRARHLK